MENRKRIFLMIAIISLLYLTLSPAPWGYADVLLDVPEKAQVHSQWCWSATSQVTLDYYGTTLSQCEIANYAWARTDCCGSSTFYWSHPCDYWNYMWGTTPYGTSGSLQNILAHWGVNSNARSYALAQNTAVSEINAGRPFVMRFGWYSGGGHFLVGYGYDQSGNYLDYMDPWPGNGYTKSLYSWVVSAAYHHDWTHTLQITTNVPPIVTSFKINNGATSTVNSSVVLNNVVRHTPTDYMVSENPGFSGASWQTYSTAPSFSLSAGSGTKTVYFKVRNTYRESSVMSDTILALAPALTSFKINSGVSTTLKNPVTLNNTATNSPTHYMVSEDSNFTGASWQVYSTAPAFLLSVGSGTKMVYFKVKNGFQESAVLSDTILAPPPGLTSFKINSGAASTASGKVTLNNVTVNGPSQYIASEASDFTGAIWETYSTAPSFTLSSGAGTKTVYFKVKNPFDESAVMTDTILSLAPVVSTFKISAGALSTVNNASVTLNNTATNLPTHFMASEASDFAGAIWQMYSAAPSFALTSGAGTKTVYFKVKNAFAESAFATDSISTLAPVVTSFKINLGAASTANGVVTLNNVATNFPTHYMASEASNFAGASWKSYSAAPKFTLGAGAGTRTVYFKVKNSFVESTAVSDTIVANGLPTVVTSFTINAGAPSTASGLVTLNNTATNLPMYYMASELSDFAGGSWQPYTTAPKFTLSAGSGTKTVYFKTINILGESPVRSDTIVALAPAVTSFKINAGAVSTANGKVTLNNVATSGPTHYMASEDPDFLGANWQTYSLAPSFVLGDGGGTKTIYFKVKNSFVESNVANDTILTNGLPPVVTSFKINSGAFNTTNGTAALNNAGTNSPTHYTASEDPNFIGASWYVYGTAPSFALSSDSGTKTVYFKLKNGFGESAVVSDTIFLY